MENETVVETVVQTDQEDLAAQQKGFEEGFGGSATEADKPQATPEPTPAPSPEPTPQPTPAPTPSPAPSPAPRQDDDVRAELRQLQGKFGDLNRELLKLKTPKEGEGDPPKPAPVDLRRLKAEYPDISEALASDLAEAMATLAPKGASPEELQALINQQVQAGIRKEAARLADEAVTTTYETWKQDLWVGGDLGKERTPEYQAWLKTMPEAEGKAFETSGSPAFVTRKLAQFYDWKTKAAKSEDDKQQRLKAALNPQGQPRAGPQTMSDEEAMRKGFAEGFNS